MDISGPRRASGRVDDRDCPIIFVFKAVFRTIVRFIKNENNEVFEDNDLRGAAGGWAVRV